MDCSFVRILRSQRNQIFLNSTSQRESNAFKPNIIERGGAKRIRVENFRRMLAEVLELLFPRRCPFCHEIVPVEDETICPFCRQFVRKYYLIREPVCKRCGKALSHMETEYCADCARHHRSFDGGISLFLYGRRYLKPVKGKKPGFEKHSMGESILRFKYHNCREYSDYYIEELMNVYGKQLRRLRPDVIIPVPLHPDRYRKRGYNQAEILARKLGEQLDTEVCSDLLIRVKKTIPQKELNDAQRLQNLREAFVLSRNVPREYGVVLLIDDIYTTGSTMEACSRRLKEAGVHKVFCISICSGQSPDEDPLQASL